VPICTENGSYYFIDVGIGNVYKLVNDTLKRIDKYFHHNNQFGGTIFTYKNRIYCFGGQGPFTFKNMITSFDENMQEWFSVDYAAEQLLPKSRANCISQINENDLYIAKGQNVTAEHPSKKSLQDVWCFNLVTKKWKNLGQIQDTTISIHLGESGTYTNIIRRGEANLY
jgi:hypothetical protein